MKKNIEIKIDQNAGFCFGVVAAIHRAEQELLKTNKLYCLGDIVHNNVEVERLAQKGLSVITYSDFDKLSEAKGANSRRSEQTNDRFDQIILDYVFPMLENIFEGGI